MATAKTDNILDGQFAVYPGHPLVVAWVIMNVYDTPDEALAMTKHGWCEAVGSNDIPGAGDGAGNGARVCRKIRDGMSGEDAADLAEELWTRMVGPGTGNHEKYYEPGREQAAAFRERFVEKAETWGRKIS
jgi:hypothetical protein